VIGTGSLFEQEFENASSFDRSPLSLVSLDPMLVEVAGPGWANLGQAVMQPILEAVTFSLVDGPTSTDGPELTAPALDAEKPVDSNLAEAPASLHRTTTDPVALHVALMHDMGSHLPV
jgi:hypothetical protein